MSDRINRQWRLDARPVGEPAASDFRWAEEEVRPLAGGELLVRNVYLSLDPANRVWMDAAPSYLPAVEIGEVMRGFALGVVEESRHEGFAPGDVVQGMFGWQDYAIASGEFVVKVPPLPLPLHAQLGLLGHIGLTAYFGLLDIGKPGAGDTLVVSAAAGAVGSLVGQIGKIKGCRVVGIAGSDEKCAWITGELGFDAAINYRKGSVIRGLMRHCPKGIDVYFDNVGGDILDAALRFINLRARVVLCGMVARYNTGQPLPGPSYLANAINRRARLEGFIVMDYFPRAREAVEDLVRWYVEGKIKYRVDVVEGLEHAPAALSRLFRGENHGKLIVKVAEEPAT